jgi:hypothetical protein
MAPPRNHSQLKPFAFLLIYKKEKKRKFTLHEEITHHIYIEKKETRDFSSSVTTEKEISKNENDYSLSLNSADNGSTFLKNKGERKMKI